MRIKNALYLTLLMLIACFATAQVPCGPNITASPTLFVNWQHFHYDLAQTGCNPYESVLNPTTVGGLTLGWKYPMQNGVAHSSPAVANGVVYIGSYDFNIYAINANSGLLIWRYQTEDEVVSSPAVADGVVYTCSLDGNIYALSTNGGQLLWKYSVRACYSSPTVANGVVYIGGFTGLSALDAIHGTLIWEYPILDGIGYSAAAFANGVVYVNDLDNYIDAIDATTGVLVWKRYVGCGRCTTIETSPAVAGNIVYVAGELDVFALNATTGEVVWEYPIGGTSSPAVANDVVYGGSYDYLFALNASTGVLLWQYLTPGIVNSSPAVANGVVYFGVNNILMPDAYALDAGSGRLLWNYYVSDPVDSSPAVANGVVYVGSRDGNLYAFHLANH